MTEGKACAVFECEAEKEALMQELSAVRHVLGTSAAVFADVIEVKGDAGGTGGRLYGMEVRAAGKTNKEAADELAAILNLAYQSPLWKR